MNCCLSCVVESGAYPTRTRQYICKACIQTVTQKDLTARTGMWFWNHLATVNSIVYNCSSNYIKTAEEAKTKLEEQKVFYLHPLVVIVFTNTSLTFMSSLFWPGLVCFPYEQ